MVERLLLDLDRLGFVGQIVLTLNLPGESITIPQGLDVRVINNECPTGFARNHNRAFSFCTSEYFCVLNPDLRLQEDPFPILLPDLTAKVGLVAPMVRTSSGKVEDSARFFPSASDLLRKLFFRHRDGRYPFEKEKPSAVEWVAGMFMLIPAEVFQQMRGFDERFYLYYEDVDLCARLWLADLQVKFDPRVSVVHDAQRTSRRNVAYFVRHLRSIATYLMLHRANIEKIREKIGRA